VVAQERQVRRCFIGGDGWRHEAMGMPRMQAQRHHDTASFGGRLDLQHAAPLERQHGHETRAAERRAQQGGRQRRGGLRVIVIIALVGLGLALELLVHVAVAVDDEAVREAGEVRLDGFGGRRCVELGGHGCSSRSFEADEALVGGERKEHRRHE